MRLRTRGGVWVPGPRGAVSRVLASRRDPRARPVGVGVCAPVRRIPAGFRVKCAPTVRVVRPASYARLVYAADGPHGHGAAVAGRGPRAGPRCSAARIHSGTPVLAPMCRSIYKYKTARVLRGSAPAN